VSRFRETFRRTRLYAPARVLREAVFPSAYYREDAARLVRYAEFYGQFIRPRDLVFDVGANFGHRTRAFRSIGATVVAVEPQAICARYLRWKLRRGVFVEQIALSDKVGFADLYESNLDSLSTLSNDWISRARQARFPSVSWRQPVRVETSTLDRLLAKYGRPQFCKIDVEAHEPQVVRGLSESIPWLSIEYMVPENSDLLCLTIDRLAEIDPGVTFNYSPGDAMALASAEWWDLSEARARFSSAEFVQTGWGDIYVHMPGAGKRR
jgi:FkbM family methyltransferase